MIKTLLADLNPLHTTVLTPNLRLTATTHKQINQYQIEHGKTCWLTHDILPFNTWIQRLWTEYATRECDTSLVLTANQELVLWEEIIALSPESENIMMLADLAKQARTAWNTLKQWRTDYHHPMFTLSENSRAFLHWAEQFAIRCQKEQWLESANVMDCVIAKIEKNEIVLPKTIILLNFTELTPQQEVLVNTCLTMGTEIKILKPAAQPLEDVRYITLNHEEHEFQTMARWAKRINEKYPEATIGCIATQLEEKRDTIISIFTDTLGTQEQFNISAGKTIATYPIIQAALPLLNLPLDRISMDTLSRLLHSPFIGDAEHEMLDRVRLDSTLRRQNVTVISWAELCHSRLGGKPSTHGTDSADRRIDSRLRGNDTSKFNERIEQYLLKRRTQPALNKTSYWMRCFSELLEILGWPGEQSLNSTEYQVIKCWQDLLREASTLDSILPPVSYKKALHYLTGLATKTFFQPQTPLAPIQILGQLEGAGIPFDYLWVMGLDDTSWPAPPSPNPLIPNELQKQLQMPNASAERQLNYSVKLTEQFIQSASTVIFSSAQHNAKEELRPSPLITQFHKAEIHDLDLTPIHSTLHQLFLTRACETIQDEHATPIKIDEKIPGGASLFEMQAACPFKAFAKLRLGARAIEESQAGLPARNRGSVIHKVLELFWREINDQKTLLLLSDEELHTLITRTVLSALNELAPFIIKESHFRSLVTQRIEKLVLRWIKIEKSRPPFKVIAVEQEKIITIDGKSISIRVDRIDELANGEKLIIDYKTKKNCDTKDWFGDRPIEPQLPLYCITSNELALGIAYAQLHTATIAFNGIALEDCDIPGIKTITAKSNMDAATWQEQLLQWRITLTQLFRNFQNGQAQVDPKENKTCEYCDLQSLCRIKDNGATI